MSEGRVDVDVEDLLDVLHDEDVHFLALEPAMPDRHVMVVNFGDRALDLIQRAPRSHESMPIMWNSCGTKVGKPY